MQVSVRLLEGHLLKGYPLLRFLTTYWLCKFIGLYIRASKHNHPEKDFTFKFISNVSISLLIEVQKVQCPELILGDFAY